MAGNKKSALDTGKKAGGFVVHKVLGIRPDNQQSMPDRVTRGESVISTFSTTETFVETDPTTVSFLREVLPNRHEIGSYLSGLLPLCVLARHPNASEADLAYLPQQHQVDHALQFAVVCWGSHRRRHHWSCCRTPRYGLCQAGHSPRAIRSLLLFRRRCRLLALCYLKRVSFICRT